MQMPMTTTFFRGTRVARALAWMLVASLSGGALAQQTADDEVAPPDRVARLSVTQGGVSLQAVGETGWAPAPVNRPIVPGDYLRTEPDGRAELQTEGAAIRVGSGTEFTFLTLDESAVRMRVSTGVLNIRVRDLGENDVVEVETPQAVAAILRPGNYRLEVDRTGGATVVKVSSGMLEARTAGQSLVVRAQQTATLTGTDRLAYTTGTLGSPDSFDEWSLARDREMEEALSTESSRFVDRDVVGYEDLERYGEWRSEPEYGYVWTPSRVVSGWSPYSFGRYSYVSGWGWTWIDDAPWGFAPFHYGSWVTIGNRWCWVPGPRHGRPIRHPIGRPRSPTHEWHVPRTPSRGISTRDADRTALNPRFRKAPDGGVRYHRPQIPQTSTPGVVGSPAIGSPALNERRYRIPRIEQPNGGLPRNSFPRPESRVQPGTGRAPIMRSAPGGYQPPQRYQAPPRTVSPPRSFTPPREISRPNVTRPATPPPQSAQPSSPRPVFRGVERGRSGQSSRALQER